MIDYITPTILLIAAASAVLLAIEIRSERRSNVVTIQNFRAICSDCCGISKLCKGDHARHERATERVMRVAERVHRAIGNAG